MWTDECWASPPRDLHTLPHSVKIHRPPEDAAMGGMTVGEGVENFVEEGEKLREDDTCGTRCLPNNWEDSCDASPFFSPTTFIHPPWTPPIGLGLTVPLCKLYHYVQKTFAATCHCQEEPNHAARRFLLLTKHRLAVSHGRRASLHGPGTSAVYRTSQDSPGYENFQQMSDNWFKTLLPQQ